MEITDTKNIWIVCGNTDLTEGRGKNTINHVCDCKATALRLGRKRYVQGSDCPVYQGVAVKFGNQWYIPGCVEKATKEDLEEQARVDAKQSALEKAKNAGMTDDEIKLISS